MGLIASLKRAEETVVPSFPLALTITGIPPAAGCPTDAGDKSAVVRALFADTDFVGLARHSSVADINIVIARGEIPTGLKAQGDIAPAGCVIERLSTVGCVEAAGLVVKERLITE
jgi:hypothetical protein